MNLHQFRFVQEAVRRNLNLTDTAKALRPHGTTCCSPTPCKAGSAMSMQAISASIHALPPRC